MYQYEGAANLGVSFVSKVSVVIYLSLSKYLSLSILNNWAHFETMTYLIDQRRKINLQN